MAKGGNGKLKQKNVFVYTWIPSPSTGVHAVKLSRKVDKMSSDKANKDIFTLFDKQAKGAIPKQQLGDYLRAIGYNPTNQLVEEVSGEAADELTLDDITGLISKNKDALQATTQGKVEDFIKAFQVFDKENTGKVTVGDIRYMLTGLGERLSDDEVDELLKGVEVDTNGGVDYKKFIEDVLRQ